MGIRKWLIIYQKEMWMEKESSLIAEYAICFYTFATANSWNDVALHMHL